MPKNGIPKNKFLSPQQNQACLILLRDQDVDREAMDTAIEAMAQAGMLNSRAVTALQRFLRAEGREVSAHGSVAALCTELIRQDADWGQVVGGINDSNMNFTLGTGLMLLSGPGDVSDEVREQVMQEGAGRVLAQYLRERAVRALERKGELDDRALAVMRDRLHDPKEDIPVWEELVSTLAHVSRKNAAARALFLGLLHEESLTDLVSFRVVQALEGMFPLQTPEMEALRTVMRTSTHRDLRMCAAKALILAGVLNAPNTEAFITLLHELQAERQRESATALYQFKTEADQAEGEGTGQEEALAQANVREQNRRAEDERWLQWIRQLPYCSSVQNGKKLLARIAGDGEIACEMREGALSTLAITQHGKGLEESLLAQCLREAECDASLSLQAADLLYKRTHLLNWREELQPQTIAAMVEVITDKGRSPELRNKVADAIGGNARLQPDQAQRLFAVVEDKDETGRLRGQIVSALTQSNCLTEPMFTLLVEWVRDTATPSDLRGSAALALGTTNNLQRIGREALLNFLGDASLGRKWRAGVGAQVAHSHQFDAELVPALVRLLAVPALQGASLNWPVRALWQVARQDASVFQALVVFLRNAQEAVNVRGDLAYGLSSYGLSSEEHLPAEMLSVLQAIVRDRSVDTYVRKALQYMLKRDWLKRDWLKN